MRHPGGSISIATPLARDTKRVKEPLGAISRNNLKKGHIRPMAQSRRGQGTYRRAEFNGLQLR
jgi:hypothetical protein